MRDEPVLDSSASSPLPTPIIPFNEPRAVALADLLVVLQATQPLGDVNVLIQDVTYRSRDVRPGSLFFCVPGHHVDGHEFGPAAAAAGAGAIVVERWVEADCTQVLVESVRRAM